MASLASLDLRQPGSLSGLRGRQPCGLGLRGLLPLRLEGRLLLSLGLRSGFSGCRSGCRLGRSLGRRSRLRRLPVQPRSG